MRIAACALALVRRSTWLIAGYPPGTLAWSPAFYDGELITCGVYPGSFQVSKNLVHDNDGTEIHA